MKETENQNNESFFSLGLKTVDSICAWINRRIGIWWIILLLWIMVMFAGLFKRWSDSGWSLFDNRVDIVVTNGHFDTGMEYWEQLDYWKAEENLLLALEETADVKGNGNLETAAVSQKLGALYLDMGRYEESYELLNSAYVSFYNQLGENDSNTIIAKCQIGLYDIRTGNVERGFAVLNEAFDQTKYYVHKMQICQMTAQCKILIGDYRGALEWHRVIQPMYDYMDETSILTINFDNDYGVLLLELGEYERALNVFLSAVQDWQSLNIEEEGTIANIYANLAQACALCNRYEDALQIGEKSISVWKALYGEESVYIARAYERMAAVYCDMKMYDMQEEYLQRALDMALTVVGKNHELTAEIYNGLGMYYYESGDMQTAVHYYMEAIEIRKNILGKDNMATAAMYQNLANTFNDMEQYEDGMENALEAVGIYESLYGRDNIYTASSYITLARSYTMTGNAEEARRYVKFALDISDRHVSSANTIAADIYLTAGDIYVFQNCYEEAYLSYQKAWKFYCLLFTDRDSFSGYFQERLTRLYAAQGSQEAYGRWIAVWKDGYE